MKIYTHSEMVTAIRKTNRPFPHYAPVSKHLEMRMRFGWTISYKSLYFVHPSLELVPLFTGKVYSSWNFVKVLLCKSRNNFLLLIRKREWSCRHCSGRASLTVPDFTKIYQYLSLRLCTITTTRLQKRSEQCSPVGMGPWDRQCLTLIFQYQDSTLIIICKT